MKNKLQHIILLTVINTIISIIVFVLFFEFYLYEYYCYVPCRSSIVSCIINRFPSFYSCYSVVYLIISFIYSILFFSFRLYEKTKRYGLLLLKLFVIILILWAVGLFLFAINTFYWGYWSHLSFGEWWLNVLVRYLEHCIFKYYASIGIWIITTITTTSQLCRFNPKIQLLA
jgi:hypothetical protein